MEYLLNVWILLQSTSRGKISIHSNFLHQEPTNKWLNISVPFYVCDWVTSGILEAATYIELESTSHAKNIKHRREDSVKKTCLVNSFLPQSLIPSNIHFKMLSIFGSSIAEIQLHMMVSTLIQTKSVGKTYIKWGRKLLLSPGCIGSGGGDVLRSN